MRNWSRSRVADLVPVSAALVVLGVVLWPLHRMRFGIVDDHDLLVIAGPDRRLPLGHFLSALVHVQDAPGRVRPVFWFGRVAELVLWGPHVELWYLSRALMAGVTLVAIYLVVRRYVPAPAAAALSLVPMLGLPAETWMRLAAAESYAMPLLCVGICGITSARARERGPASVAWAYLALVLAAGAKESFVPVVALVLLAVLVTRWSGMQGLDRVTVLSASAATLALGAWVAVAVSTSGDPFQRQRTVAAIADVAKYQASGTELRWHVVAGALVLAVAGWRFRARPDRTGRLVAATVVLAVLSQVLLYAGGAEAGRYLYPLALLPVATWLCALSPLGRTTEPRRILGWSLTALALVLALAVQLPDTRAQARTATGVTRAFQADLATIRHDVLASGADAVVIEPVDPQHDTELVLSFSRYLGDLGVPVMTTPASGEGSSPLDRSMAAGLRDWSERGSSSLVPLDLSQPCFSVVLGDRAPVCSRSFAYALRIQD